MSTLSGPLRDAPIDLQEHFRELMASVGITPGRGAEEFHLCPWHNDRKHPNLKVNWRACVFICFACATKGGIRELRRLLGKDQTRERHDPGRDEKKRLHVKGVAVDDEHGGDYQLSDASDNWPAGARRTIDRERERDRLVSAMREWGGLFAEFNRSTGRLMYETVIECRRTWGKWECPNDGSRKVTAASCGFPLCTMCMPGRLRADFKRHAENLPERLDLYVWTPPAGKVTRQEIGAAFNHWRRSNGIAAGIYGVRLTVGAPDVLLVVPAEFRDKAFVTKFVPIATDVSLDQAVEWYVSKYLGEITSWKTPEEMVELLEAVKGRRKFQGFGSYFAKEKQEDQVRVITDTPKRLGRVAGGSGKGGKESVTCDHCGSKMRRVGVALTQEEAEAWARLSPIGNNPQSKPRQAA